MKQQKKQVTKVKAKKKEGKPSHESSLAVVLVPAVHGAVAPFPIVYTEMGKKPKNYYALGQTISFPRALITLGCDMLGYYRQTAREALEMRRAQLQELKPEKNSLRGDKKVKYFEQYPKVISRQRPFRPSYDHNLTFSAIGVYSVIRMSGHRAA